MNVSEKKYVKYGRTEKNMKTWANMGLCTANMQTATLPEEKCLLLAYVDFLIAQHSVSFQKLNDDIVGLKHIHSLSVTFFNTKT